MPNQNYYSTSIQPQPQRRGKYCQNCGSLIDYESIICPKCGVQVGNLQRNYIKDKNISEKDWLSALLLCLFLGNLGIHRFYVGKVGTGILWLLTLGCLGIGTIVDFIMICVGTFKDKDGRYLKKD